VYLRPDRPNIAGLIQSETSEAVRTTMHQGVLDLAAAGYVGLDQRGSLKLGVQRF
jgi:hypothetical protein